MSTPLGLARRRSAPRRPRASARRALRAAVESLELRTLLSAAPPLYRFESESYRGDLPGGPGFAGSSSAPAIEVRPMHLSRVEGTLGPEDPGDVVLVGLEAGQVVTLGVAVASAAASPVRLSVGDASGRVLASSAGVAADPATGRPGDGPALAFRAPASGTYLIGLSNEVPATAPGGRAYALDVRPIGLDPEARSQPDEAVLGGLADAPTAGAGVSLASAAATSGITAMLRNGRLQLVGPTGYGFEMTGNWTQIASSVGGQTRLTFVASAGVNVVSPIGNLPMPVPPGGSFIITTLPNNAGGAFGEVDRMRITTGFPWLDALATFMRGAYGQTTTLPGLGTVDYRQGINLGIALGSTITRTVDAAAPVNENVPYLYFVASSGVAVSFGNFSASAGAAGGQTKLSVIADPADPSLYIGVVTPGDVPVFAGAGIGLSANGRIPFAPATVPESLPQGFTFRGHVYGQLELNIPAYKVVNVNVNGKAVINVDANGDGELIQFLKDNPQVTLGGAWAAGTLGLAFANNPALFTNLAVGASATIGVNVSIPTLANATFTLGKAGAIYTGTASPDLYFRGEATNNLLRGTLLEQVNAFLQPTQTFILDGSASPGRLDATYTAIYQFFGSRTTASVRVVGTDLNGTNPSVTATLSGRLDTLLDLASVGYTGTVDTQGRFQIDGDANVTIAGFTLAGGRFRIVNEGITIRGDLNLGALGSATVVSAATTDGNFALAGVMRTNFGLAFGPQLDAALTLSNAGLSAGTTVTFLGQQASLSGAIQPNLDFRLTGTVDVGLTTTIAGFEVGPTARFDVTLAAAGGVVSYSGSTRMTFGTPLADFELALTVFLAYAAAGITFSGSGTASASNSLIGTLSGTLTIDNAGIHVDFASLVSFTIPWPF